MAGVEQRAGRQKVGKDRGEKVVSLLSMTRNYREISNWDLLSLYSPGTVNRLVV